jgi:hypothetical protein
MKVIHPVRVLKLTQIWIQRISSRTLSLLRMTLKMMKVIKINKRTKVRGRI